MGYHTNQLMDKTPLSYVEKQTLELLCEEGLSAKEISNYLKLAPCSIERATCTLYRRYGVNSQRQMIIVYWKNKLQRIVDMEIEESERQETKGAEQERRSCYRSRSMYLKRFLLFLSLVSLWISLSKVDLFMPGEYSTVFS